MEPESFSQGACLPDLQTLAGRIELAILIELAGHRWREKTAPWGIPWEAPLRDRLRNPRHGPRWREIRKTSQDRAAIARRL